MPGSETVTQALLRVLSPPWAAPNPNSEYRETLADPATQKRKPADDADDKVEHFRCIDRGVIFK